ncbi:MAG: tripartite tricarboxylate transporter TctB family protein [Rhodobacteraceae bacterium]|nr:tripartite tricarboxylate transporter TctB family protein [Paracoccaceae bacterium]
MRQADLVSGVILGLFGLVMLLVVIPAQIEQAPRGFVSPRLVPNMMMIAVTGLSLLLVLKALRGAGYRGGDDAGLFPRHEIMVSLRLVLVFALAIALFVWTVPLAAGIALIVGALLALGERRPIVLIVMPAALLLAVWALFYKLLGTAIL